MFLQNLMTINQDILSFNHFPISTHNASSSIIHPLKNLPLSRIEIFRFDYSSGVKKTPHEYPLRGYKYCVASSRTSKSVLFFFLPFLPLPLPFPLHPPSLLFFSSFLLFLTPEPRRKRRFRKQKRSHSRVLQREKIRDWDARESSEKERERETKGGRVPVKEDSVSLFAGGLIRAQGHFYTEPSHSHGDCLLWIFFFISAIPFTFGPLLLEFPRTT